MLALGKSEAQYSSGATIKTTNLILRAGMPCMCDAACRAFSVVSTVVSLLEQKCKRSEENIKCVVSCEDCNPDTLFMPLLKYLYLKNLAKNYKLYEKREREREIRRLVELA